MKTVFTSLFCNLKYAFRSAKFWIAAAALFSEEWCSGRFVFSYTRSKKFVYAASLILSSFFIAALTAAISMRAYILIFSFTNPFTADPQNGGFMQIVRSYANGGLMAQGHFLHIIFLQF